MRTKIAVAALAGGLALTGGLLVAPGIAVAADPGTGVSDRLTAIKDALKGLVSDKTLTQEQADKVAATLDSKLPRRGPGGPGHRHHVARLAAEAVAKVLGITVEELRTQQRAGKTLAQIAAAEGISKATLIDGLVKAAEAELAAAVKDGRLTQAQADEMKSGLRARITEKVDKVGPGPRGPGGFGRHHHHGPPPGNAPADEVPSGSVAPSGMTETASA